MHFCYATNTLLVLLFNTSLAEEELWGVKICGLKDYDILYLFKNIHHLWKYFFLFLFSKKTVRYNAQAITSKETSNLKRWSSNLFHLKVNQIA